MITSICQPTWIGAQPMEGYVGEGQVDGVRTEEPLIKALGNHAGNDALQIYIQF